MIKATSFGYFLYDSVTADNCKCYCLQLTFSSLGLQTKM